MYECYIRSMQSTRSGTWEINTCEGYANNRAFGIQTFYVIDDTDVRFLQSLLNSSRRLPIRVVLTYDSAHYAWAIEEIT